ncbi:MAG: hypothetical protein AAGG01_20990, partial [Planctomycetota bacterium]
VEFISLVVTRDDIGDLAVHVNGFEEGRLLAAGVDAGLDRNWSVLAPEGAMGGSDGPGVLPFAATRSVGDLAGVGIVDRALALNEIQSEYARYSSYIYCQGRANTTGTAAKLSLSGSFRRDDNRLFTRVTDLPAGTVGYLVASLTQQRTAISGGTLCIAGDILRLSNQVYFANGLGEVSDSLDLGVAPPPILVATSPIWNFQFWYRDGAISNFTNGLNILFGS